MAFPENREVIENFPKSSQKTARAINAASGNRPAVVLANLSGFDGSPESMRTLPLEYGAEIGRAVVNFRDHSRRCAVGASGHRRHRARPWELFCVLRERDGLMRDLA